MKKIFKIALLAIMTLFILLSSILVNAAGSAPVKLSASKTTLTVGETVTLTVDHSSTDYYYLFDIINSNASVITITGRTRFADSLVETVTITAKAAGSATISVKDQGTINNNEESVPATGSITFTVKNPTSGGSNGGSGNSNTNNQTETQKKPSTPTKSAEQLAAEALEKRKKTPLISMIDLVDGKDNAVVFTSLETKIDVFEYKYEVPKNVSLVDLRYTKLADNVSITGPESIQFADGEFEKSITLDLVQDVVSQKLTITLTRPVTASTTQDYDGRILRIVDNDDLDAFLKPYGFERTIYTDANGNESFYYDNGIIRVQLYADEANRAYWLLLDNNNAVVREVIGVFSNNGHSVSFLWEAPDYIQALTHKKVKYESYTFAMMQQLQAVDPTLTFNLTIGGWVIENLDIEETSSTSNDVFLVEVVGEETSDSLTGGLLDTGPGFLAYGIDSYGEEGLKFISAKNHASMIAFASFDSKSSSTSIVPYVLFGATTATTILFLVLWIIERRKEPEIVYSRSSGSRTNAYDLRKQHDDSET